MAYPRLHAISVSRVKVRGIYHITPYQSASAVFSSAENRAETSLVRWGQFRWKDGVSQVDGVNRQLLGGQPLLYISKQSGVSHVDSTSPKQIILKNVNCYSKPWLRHPRLLQKGWFSLLAKGASRFRNSKSFLVTPVWLAKTKPAIVWNVLP